jgi:hypothetical protein
LRTSILFVIALSCFMLRISLAAPVELRQHAGRWILHIAASPETAWLQQARGKDGRPVTVPFSLTPGTWLSAPLRPDNSLEAPLSLTDLAALTPGTNTFTLQLPGWRDEKLSFDASPLFRQDKDLRAYAEARIQHIALPAVPAGTTVPQDAAVTASLAGVTFAEVKRLPITLFAPQRPRAVLPLSGSARKLYLRLDVHGGQNASVWIDVTGPEGLLTRRLVHPSGPSNETSVTEIDLGEMRRVSSLEIETAGPGTRAALYAVSALGPLQPGAYGKLPPRIQALTRNEPVTLFSFNQPSIAGWEVIGSGWGTTDTMGEFFSRKGTSRYFADSKANGGEIATGTILSPPFTLRGAKLTFLANGHGVKNYYALIDAASRAELLRAPAPEKTGPFEKISWDIRELQGRQVRFKAVDEDPRDAYAWIAFDDITLVP